MLQLPITTVKRFVHLLRVDLPCIHVVLNVLSASLINRVACFGDWNTPRKQISESREQLSWSTFMAQGPTLLQHGEPREIL